MFLSLMQSLGVNSTVFIQFFIFLLFYPVLSRLLFSPFIKIQIQRDNETIEQMKQGEALKNRKQNLQEKYKKLVTSYNTEFNKMYNKESQEIKHRFLNQKIKNQNEGLKQRKKKIQTLFQEIKIAENQLQENVKDFTKIAINQLVY